MSDTTNKLEASLDDLALAVDEMTVNMFKASLWKSAMARAVNLYALQNDDIFASVEAELRADWPAIVATGHEAAIQEALTEFRSEARAILKQS